MKRQPIKGDDPREVRKAARDWRNRRRASDPSVFMGLLGGVSVDDQDAAVAVNSGGADTAAGGSSRTPTAGVYES